MTTGRIRGEPPQEPSKSTRSMRYRSRYTPAGAHTLRRGFVPRVPRKTRVGGSSTVVEVITVCHLAGEDTVGFADAGEARGSQGI